MFSSEIQRKRRRNRKIWCGACVNIDASVPNSINIQDTTLVRYYILLLQLRLSEWGKNPIYLPWKFDLDFEQVSNT